MLHVEANPLSEQHRILAETHALQKNEYVSLEAQVRQLQGQVSQTQLERRQALEEVATHKAAEARLRDESSLLRAEKEQWESVASRREADFAQVQQERAHLKYLMSNMDSVTTESDRARSEERTKLERRIEDLQREAWVHLALCTADPPVPLFVPRLTRRARQPVPQR